MIIFLLCTALFNVVSFFFGDGGSEVRLVAETPQPSVVEDSHRRTRVPKPAWPNPAIVVGLAKTGTQSLADYFKCGCFKNVTHWKGCNPGRTQRPRDGICGIVIKRNVRAGVDPLLNTGDWDVYSQIEATNPRQTCFYPQIDALEEIHAYHPNSTFILNTRNATNWINSVNRWNNMRQRFIKCNLKDLPAGVGREDEDMIRFFHKQAQRIRDFCKEYPSHALVEIDIESNETGKVLEEAFGIASECWGKNTHRGESGVQDLQICEHSSSSR